MPNLIDSYLANLKSCLQKRLPAEHVKEILLEAESHLREKVQSGISEAEAIKAYGSVQRVAGGYIRRRTQKLLGLPTSIVVFAATAICCFCWIFHWLTLDRFFDNFGESWQNELAGVIGTIALVICTVASRRAWRSHAGVILAACAVSAVVSVPLLSFWMVTSPDQPEEGLSRLHLKRDIPKVEGAVNWLGRYRDYVSTGMKAYATARSEGDLPDAYRKQPMALNGFGTLESLSRNEGMVVAQLPVPREQGVFALTDGRVFVLEPKPTFQEAQTAWAKFGAITLSQIDARTLDMRSILIQARLAQRGKLFFFNASLISEVLFGIAFLLPLILLGDVLGLLRRRSARMRLA